jgi:uncharacterized NAD(P)/FAD-binding protein YdhS
VINENNQTMALGAARVVAIVGGGFSGTATAINLLRHPGACPLRIRLIERSSEFGRGLAYARTPYPYLLNVPASRMSATVADPDEFLRYARTRDPLVSGEDFLPRALYGEYLQHMLQEAAIWAPSSTSLERLNAEVVRVSDSSGGASMELANGVRLHADALVLALGSPLPRLPESIRCSVTAPLLRRDPWAGRGSLPPRRGPLLVIGTGLSMADIVCEALSRDPGIEIHAISRHGLVPPTQTQFRPNALVNDGGLLAQSAGSTRRLAAVIRRLVVAAEKGGGDWREVVTLVRHQTSALWNGLGPVERDRFLRHVRAYWDIHRHRIPAGVHARIEALRASGQLRIHAGRLSALEHSAVGVHACWVERGSGQHRTLDAAEVVNCSGPDYDVTRSREALWISLLACGLVVPDTLRLGIRTGRGGALLMRDGGLSSRVFYVGPMLRADHWEATAVGELRVHTQRLADNLRDLMPQFAGARKSRPAPPPCEVVPW